MQHTRFAGLLALGLALAPATAQAQIPDKFKNLQVLPKDIAKAELVKTMRQWTSDLGLRCHNCHVGPDNLEGMDFASDDKPQKRAAREMLRMLQSINDTTIKALPPRDAPRDGVSCGTCHRGAPLPPLPLHEELLRKALAQGGAAAAIERYRELRREHPADGRYDFSPSPLVVATMRLKDAGHRDEALSIARLGLEEHPAFARLHVLAGELLLDKGERAAAAQSFRKAIELEPQNPAARNGLKRAEEPTPAP